MLNRIAANHYVLDGVVAGTVDTFALAGTPQVSLYVYGDEAQRAQVRESVAGLEITGLLGERPDLDSTHLLLVLPRGHVADDPIQVGCLAIRVNARTSSPVPDPGRGPLQNYAGQPV